MSVIEMSGLFKGEIKDSVVSLTRKAELPQFVVTILATECYDEANEVWEDWSEYQATITGYMVLVSFDKKTGQLAKCFAYDNIVEAVGWDGETYSGLNAMDLKGKRIQFRVIEDTFEGTTRFKVNAIAAEDAEVGLRKLSDKDLANIDAKFGVAATKKKTATKPPKKSPPKKTTPPKTTKKVEPCTEEAAYQACIDANEALVKSVPSEVLDDYWVTRTDEIAANADDVTNEEWGNIRNAVLTDIDIPF